MAPSPVIPPPKHLSDPVAPAQEWSFAQLNDFYFDTGFVDAVQCTPAICDEIRNKYTMKDFVWPDRGKQYKYIMDVSNFAASFSRDADSNASQLDGNGGQQSRTSAACTVLMRVSQAGARVSAG